MAKNVGMRYVKDFEFPAEQGFTGSAGVQHVKGYKRGGSVKSPDKTKGKGMSKKGMPKDVKAKGGKVGYQAGGAVERPGHAEGPNPYPPDSYRYKAWERKYHIDPPTPPAAEAPPADEGGGLLGGLGRLFGRSERELEELGEAKGGYISPDKTKGKGKSKKGFPSTVKKKGGKVEAGEGGYYGKPGDQYPKRQAGPKGQQGKKLPKNVKKHGGKVGYAEGGLVHSELYKAGAAMGFAKGGYARAKDTSSEFKETRGPQDTMDSGVQPARRGANARNQQQREAGGTGRLKPGLKKGGRARKAGTRLGRATRKLASMAEGHVRRSIREAKPVLKAGQRLAQGTTRFAGGGLAKAAAEMKHVAKATRVPKPTRAAKGGYAAGDKKTHDTGRGRTPYKGYNKQPGGGGNKDARYMTGRKPRR